MATSVGADTARTPRGIDVVPVPARTAASPVLERLTRLAARLLHAPVALLALADGEVAWVAEAELPPGEPDAGPAAVARWLREQVGATGRQYVVVDFAAHAPIPCDAALRALAIRAAAAVPLVDAAGEPLGALCALSHQPREWTVEDLEGLADAALAVQAELAVRQAVRALAASEEEYRSRVELSPHMQWMGTPDGRAIGHSSRWEEFTGLPRAAAAGEGWTRAIHPDDLPRVVEATRQAMRDGTPYDVEFRMRAADGGYRWVRSRARAHRDAAGRIVRWYGTTEDVDERVRAAREQERFALATRWAMDGLWFWDMVSGEVFVSPRYRELLGYDEADFADPRAKVQELLHPEDRPRFDAALRAHLTQRAPFDLEFRLRTRGGEYRWFWNRGQAVWDDAGRAVRIAGSMSDVDDRHRAEAALRESEARFQRMASSIQEAFWMASLSTGQVLYLSPAFERLWGVSPEAFQQDPTLVEGLLHPEDRDATLDAFARMRGAEVVSHECRIRRPDGAVRWLLLRSFPACAGEGDGDFVTGIASDITERKLAEQSLRESEERYRGVVRHFPDGAVFVFDRDLRYLLADGQALAAGGRAPAELVGRRLDECVPPQVAAYLEPIARAALAGEERAYQFERPDGRLYQCATLPLRDDAGRVVAGMTIARDVTEQRRQEGARAALEAQLRQAQKMEAVGRLAGGVAHDFNNLLTVIGAHSSFLMESLDSGDPRHEDARAIHQAGVRAAGLTRQLLAFGRKQILRPERVSLNVVMEETRKMLTRVLGEDIELRTALAEDLWPVVADAGQIDQVLVNLAVNARDAMPAGGQLTLTTRNVVVGDDAHDDGGPVPAGEYVRVEVRDTGVGMDAGVQSRLFEPFFTTKEPGKGTGLGLATAYGIIKQSGGFVLVESAPGAGSSFQVYLPRAASAERGESARDAEPAPAQGRETVLLVEDEPAVRAIAKHVLRRHGYAVLEAGGGDEALAIAATFASPIHLVLSDVVMPGMSGAEVVRRLQAQRPELRVVFMSGYTDDEVVRRGIVSSSVPFVQKPFAPSELARAVREVLDRPAAAGARL